MIICHRWKFPFHSFEDSLFRLLTLSAKICMYSWHYCYWLFSNYPYIVSITRGKPVCLASIYFIKYVPNPDLFICVFQDTLHATPAKEVSFEEHCKYKYLFNFRGVAASFRFKHILLCKSLVFHVGNQWLEFFYPALKPWIHYVPVDANASEKELKEIIEFMKSHDVLAKEIAENGYNMIWNNLKLKDVSCYWKKLIRRYAKLLKFEPTLIESLIEIRM